MRKNTLYYGDNLDILRAHIPDESVDLIYLDPPFNSRRSYNVLFREANGTAADSQSSAVESLFAACTVPSDALRCMWADRNAPRTFHKAAFVVEWGGVMARAWA